MGRAAEGGRRAEPHYSNICFFSNGRGLLKESVHLGPSSQRSHLACGLWPLKKVGILSHHSCSVHVSNFYSIRVPTRCEITIPFPHQIPRSPATASAMASSAATTSDGEKQRAHLGQPLLAPPQAPQQPYYAYPAASYAHPSPPPPPPPPTLVFVPVPAAPCSPVLVRLRRLRLRPRRAPCLRRTLLLLFVLALLGGAAFLLYPSAPAARVADLRVDSFRVEPPALDLGLALRLRVRNPGFLLPLRYRAVSAAVSYRGHLLGSAKAWPGSGELAARDEVYADAQVWVDAGRVLDDVIELIGDVAAGSVPLEIVSEVVGSIKVFRFHIPVKGLISCSVNISPETQRIISQDCY